MIYFWATNNEAPLFILQGHSNSVTDLLIPTDSKYLVSTSYDKTVIVWDLRERTPAKIMKGHSDAVLSITELENYIIATTAKNNELLIWDLDDFSIVKDIQSNVTKNNQISISCPNRLLTIKEKSMSKATVTIGCNEQSDRGSGIGCFLYQTQKSVGYGGGKRVIFVKYYEFSDKEAIGRCSSFSLIMGSSNLLELFKEKKDVKTGNKYGGKYGDSLINSSTYESNYERIGNEEKTNQSNYGGYGNYNQQSNERNEYIIAFFNLTIKLFKFQIVENAIEKSLTFVKSVSTLQPIRSSISGVGSSFVISGGDESRLLLHGYNRKTLEIEELFKDKNSNHSKMISAIHPLRDNTIITSSRDGFMKHYCLSTQKSIHHFTGHSDSVFAIIQLSNREVCSVSRNEVISWDLSNGYSQNIVTRGEHFTAIARVSASKIVLGQGTNLLFYDLTNNPADMYCETVVHSQCVRSVVMHDSKRLVSGGDDMKVVVTRADTGDKLSSMEGHQASINQVISISEDMVGTASNDCTIRIWSLGLQRCLTVLISTENIVTSLVLLNDEVLVSGHKASQDSQGLIKYWDLPSKALIRSEVAHDGPVSCLVKLNAISFLSGSSNADVKQWLY